MQDSLRWPVGTFREVVRRDTYLIRDLKQNDIEFIIDIGACLGVFSTYARFLFPMATIIAIEPEKETYIDLEHNVKGLYVTCDNLAYGDGRDLYSTDNGGSGVQQFDNTPSNDNSYKIQSFSLTGILNKHNIKTYENCLIKFDCEGGERFLLDKNDDEIIRQCRHFCMEIHFPNETFKQFSHLPSFTQYNDWIQSFSDTHDIIYHQSNKRFGVGVYVLSKIINLR